MASRKILLTLFLILAATPLAFAGGAKKAWLARPEVAEEEAEGTQQGFVKIKADRQGDIQLFEVNAQHMAAGDHNVLIGDVVIGAFTVKADNGAGKFKINTRRGDAFDVEDPAGQTVKVLATDGLTVVLQGTIPDPAAPKVRGGNAKSDLEALAVPIDEDATGFVKAKAGPGAQLLQVVIRNVDAGTYDVFMETDEEGVFEDVGDLVVEEGEDGGSLLWNNRRGDAFPLGAASPLDLAGRAVEVRTEGETVILKGTVPDASAKKGRGPKPR